jgi:23S rRNA pseudouridine955/2504/2580 synthase/23S rRNA pseudouridine1911/1915/1917 synthase
LKRRIEFRIRDEYAGLALDAFLARRFPYHTAAEWASRIALGRVRVDGLPCDAGRVLVAGDTVSHLADDVPEPAANLDVEVLYRDEDLAVVNKPANLPTHPGGRYFHHTLWAVLRQRHAIGEPTFVNRLDRETSGLVVVALHAEAAKKCRRQFAGRRVAKRYLAIVEGCFPENIEADGLLVEDAEFGRHKRRLFKPRAGCTEGDVGEQAVTRFRLLRQVGPVSEIEAIPETGRLHQIRATLVWLGFPVVGDKLYGVDPTIFVRFCTDAMTDFDRKRLRLDRQALHAAGLSFRHPRHGRRMTFDLPLPRDLSSLLDRMASAGDGIGAPTSGT